MKEAVEITGRQELVEHLRKSWGNSVNESGSNVFVEKYGTGIDSRIGWDTHIVMVDGFPDGFTNGPIPNHEELTSEQTENILGAS